MRYRGYEGTSPKRVLMYFLRVLLVFWVIITLILEYGFLSKHGEKISKKGGTFVEATFDQVSYLPYLKNDGQSLFYQSFLFDGCANYTTLNTEGLHGEYCNILTQDYQTYYVSLASTGKVRSDYQPWTLEDVYFTYNDIIHKNIWDIKTLGNYADLIVEKEEDRIKIVFPTSTTDNNFFFAHAILPQHILGRAKFSEYISLFAANPITSSCGRLVQKSSDTQSLIFNLMQCKNTNFAFYQVKNYPNFESIAKSILENDNTIIDVYAHQIQLPNYERINITENELLTFFFNTKSPKMKVRFRRALGGLINHHFYGQEYATFLKKYEGPLLNLFYSDGSNIQEFINRISLSDEEKGVQHEDLEESGVQALKKSIRINGVERKFIFYTPKIESVFNLEIAFSNQFEKIVVKDANAHEFSPKKYKKTDKKITYPLEIGKNLHSGLNQYTIVGTLKGKTYTIANIDLYMLTSFQQPQEAQNNSKIKVVYYNNLESNFAIKQFKSILEQHQILDYFLFEQVSSPEQFEAKLIMSDYDILLNTINIGLRKDILKILTTDDVLTNPSRYTNTNLTNLFKQYSKSPQNIKIAEQINGIFAQDMPFVIVGRPFSFVNIKKDLILPSFLSGSFHSYDWRKQFYEQLTIAQGTKINIEKIKDLSGFFNYLQEESGIQRPSWSFAPDQKPQINKENPFEGLIKSADQ